MAVIVNVIVIVDYSQRQREFRESPFCEIREISVCDINSLECSV